MSEYTPTTSEVREQFARGARGGYGGSAEAGAHRHVAAQNKFDRWLAEVERAAAARWYEQGRIDQKRSSELYARYQQGDLTETEFSRLMETTNRRAAEIRERKSDG